MPGELRDLPVDRAAELVGVGRRLDVQGVSGHERTGRCYGFAEDFLTVAASR